MSALKSYLFTFMRISEFIIFMNISSDNVFSVYDFDLKDIWNLQSGKKINVFASKYKRHLLSLNLFFYLK